MQILIDKNFYKELQHSFHPDKNSITGNKKILSEKIIKEMNHQYEMNNKKFPFIYTDKDTDRRDFLLLYSTLRDINSAELCREHKKLIKNIEWDLYNSSENSDYAYLVLFTDIFKMNSVHIIEKESVNIINSFLVLNNTNYYSNDEVDNAFLTIQGITDDF